ADCWAPSSASTLALAATPNAEPTWRSTLNSVEALAVSELLIVLKATTWSAAEANPTKNPEANWTKPANQAFSACTAFISANETVAPHIAPAISSREPHRRCSQPMSCEATISPTAFGNVTNPVCHAEAPNPVWYIRVNP